MEAVLKNNTGRKIAFFIAALLRKASDLVYNALQPEVFSDTGSETNEAVEEMLLQGIPGEWAKRVVQAGKIEWLDFSEVSGLSSSTIDKQPETSSSTIVDNTIDMVSEPTVPHDRIETLSDHTVSFSPDMSFKKVSRQSRSVEAQATPQNLEITTKKGIQATIKRQKQTDPLLKQPDPGLTDTSHPEEPVPPVDHPTDSRRADSDHRMSPYSHVVSGNGDTPMPPVEPAIMPEIEKTPQNSEQISRKPVTKTIAESNKQPPKPEPVQDQTNVANQQRVEFPILRNYSGHKQHQTESRRHREIVYSSIITTHALRGVWPKLPDLNEKKQVTPQEIQDAERIAFLEREQKGAVWNVLRF